MRRFARSRPRSRSSRGASLGSHHRRRECRGCVSCRRRAASRIGRHAGRPRRACRRAPCSRTGSRPTYCSAASIPANDLAGATEALAGADLVIAATTHLTEKLREVAHVVLPVGTFAESAGTFVNVEGRWQSWTGAASAVGESRPGWKVLRVLANLLNIRGVDYVSSEEVREALKKLCGSRLTPAPTAPGSDGVAPSAAAGAGAAGGADARRALGRHSALSDRRAGARLRVARQDQGRAMWPARCSDHVAVGSHPRLARARRSRAYWSDAAAHRGADR